MECSLGCPDTETWEGSSKKWVASCLPTYKCYFRCSVVSLRSRLCCWVPSMRTIKMQCSLYMDGITSVTTILFQKRQSPGSTTLNTKQFLLIWSIFVSYIVVSACHSEAVSPDLMALLCTWSQTLAETASLHNRTFWTSFHSLKCGYFLWLLTVSKGQPH